MIKKYVYGEPFETEALTENIETAEGKPGYGEICAEDGFSFTYIMDEEDIVYGLGESTAVSTREDSFTPVTVPMIRSIQRINIPCTVHIILSLCPEKKPLECFSTIRQQLPLTLAIPEWIP